MPAVPVGGRRGGDQKEIKRLVEGGKHEGNKAERKKGRKN
jgi:hypothetical protein